MVPTKAPAASAKGQAKSTVFSETESNDTVGTADLAPLGLGPSEDDRVTLVGNLEGSVLPGTPTTFTVAPESNSTIPLATNTGITAGVPPFTTASSTITNVPSTGDFDYYRVNLAAGQFLRVDAEAPGSLDTYLRLYNASGALLTFDDDSGAGTDSLLTYDISVTADYYIMVAAFAALPTSPFSDSTGSGNGTQSTGSYSLTIRVETLGTDVFAFDLEQGSVVTCSGAGTRRLELRDPAGTPLMGSEQQLFIQAASSPMPRGGVDVGAVAPSTGRYTLTARGTGAYTIQSGVNTPGFRAQPVGTRQIIFLDFNGATVDVSTWNGGTTDLRALSPLSSFLANWGLAPGDESALITKIVADFEENLDTSLRGGLNGDARTDAPGTFDVEIRNSRDHADPFGQPNVSRIVIGGTIAESGISTIGIASSIDLGNFEGEDDSLVLLDLLSAPSSDPNSLNRYPLTGGKTRMDVVARGIANIAAHEAGHFLGLFHTEQFNAVANLIDQGGNLDNSIGVGTDDIFGSSDDVDVDFTTDELNANEGYSGFENSAATISFALSTGQLGASAAGSSWMGYQ